MPGRGPQPAPRPPPAARARRRPGSGGAVGARGPSRRDEAGGAVSLWVLLMVPVSAFAAVVAMAGPQRLAAESSMQEAADDMAMLAVAWRDGQQARTGQLDVFWAQCLDPTSQRAELEQLRLDIGTLDPSDPLGHQAEVTRLRTRLDALRDEFDMAPMDPPPTDGDELSKGLDETEKPVEEHEACYLLYESLVRDLGNLGADMGSLRGSYSDALSQTTLTGSCSDPTETTEIGCTNAGGTWTGFGSCSDPTQTSEADCTTADKTWTLCRTSRQVAVRDAVHVALAARWQDAGWAAAQVWPDGLPMAAESVGRLSQQAPQAPAAVATAVCGDWLTVLDEQGRPVWEDAPDHPSRKLQQSVGRSPLSG